MELGEAISELRRIQKQRCAKVEKEAIDYIIDELDKQYDRVTNLCNTLTELRNENVELKNQLFALHNKIKEGLRDLEDLEE